MSPSNLRRRARETALDETRGSGRALLIVCLAVCVAVGFTVWRFTVREAVRIQQSVDYELTADCLSEHQSWRNFNSTLADLEHDLRFCIDVWPATHLSAP